MSSITQPQWDALRRVSAAVAREVSTGAAAAQADRIARLEEQVRVLSGAAVNKNRVDGRVAELIQSGVRVCYAPSIPDSSGVKDGDCWWDGDDVYFFLDGLWRLEEEYRELIQRASPQKSYKHLPRLQNKSWTVSNAQLVGQRYDRLHLPGGKLHGTGEQAIAEAVRLASETGDDFVVQEVTHVVKDAGRTVSKFAPEEKPSTPYVAPSSLRFTVGWDATAWHVIDNHTSKMVFTIKAPNAEDVVRAVARAMNAL